MADCFFSLLLKLVGMSQAVVKQWTNFIQEHCAKSMHQQSQKDASTTKLLATHGWEKTGDASFSYSAIESLSTRFETPLQEAGVNCVLLQEEWNDIVYHAKQYLNLVIDSYNAIWWKLFNSTNACKWNILTLAELIFSFPLSNGHLERCFSRLKMSRKIEDHVLEKTGQKS